MAARAEVATHKAAIPADADKIARRPRPVFLIAFHPHYCYEAGSFELIAIENYAWTMDAQARRRTGGQFPPRILVRFEMKTSGRLGTATAALTFFGTGCGVPHLGKLRPGGPPLETERLERGDQLPEQGVELFPPGAVEALAPPGAIIAAS